MDCFGPSAPVKQTPPARAPGHCRRGDASLLSSDGVTDGYSHRLGNVQSAYALTFLRSLATSTLYRLSIPGRKGKAHCPEKIQYLQAFAMRSVRLVTGRTEQKKGF